MGITCAYPQVNDSNKTPREKTQECEELDVLTPRPPVKKDLVFIWHLDIFKTLIGKSCEDAQEQNSLMQLMDDLAEDIANKYFYLDDIKDYDLFNIYENPVNDTGQSIRQSGMDYLEAQKTENLDNITLEEKLKVNKLSSLCRKVKESYCSNCRTNIDDLISSERKEQWENVRQNMDALKDKWQTEALKSLKIINTRNSCVNVLLTTGHLVKALSTILLLQMGEIFTIDNIYSTANKGKEECFKKIAHQFGSDCSVFIFGVKNQDEKIAEKLNMAFWKVADQADVDSLHHALKHNYL